MSVENRQIVFYLGYHKTASKWIWNNFFRKYYPCHQIGRLSEAEVRTLIQHVKKESPIILRDRIENGLMGSDFSDLPTKLSNFAPKGKLVTCIRSQHSMLSSHYGQYVANGGRLGFKAYVQEAVETRWHYYSLLKDLMENADRQVFVYLFEEFRRDPLDVLRRLHQFVGPPGQAIPEKKLETTAQLPRMNPKRHDLVVDTMLILNRMRLRHEKNAVLPELKRAGSDHIVVEAAEYISKMYSHARGRPIAYRKFKATSILEEAYAEENDKLSKLLNKPLHQYGYPSLVVN